MENTRIRTSATKVREKIDRGRKWNSRENRNFNRFPWFAAMRTQYERHWIVLQKTWMSEKLWTIVGACVCALHTGGKTETMWEEMAVIWISNAFRCVFVKWRFICLGPAYCHQRNKIHYYVVLFTISITAAVAPDANKDNNNNNSKKKKKKTTTNANFNFSLCQQRHKSIVCACV